MFGGAKQQGIVYRSLKDILGEGDKESVRVGTFVQVIVLEIYNEEIYDLLSTNNGGGPSIGWSKGSVSKVFCSALSPSCPSSGAGSASVLGNFVYEFSWAAFCSGSESVFRLPWKDAVLICILLVLATEFGMLTHAILADMLVGCIVFSCVGLFYSEFGAELCRFGYGATLHMG
ncbi:Kinesin-like protein KIN-10A [Camellia lanceoleosa]|uniref:Kinesin-like protein KIN-10A n=1 Tax=Camellia lanceoleosa TaxID=1840588 RepID=A0ACC0H767_9ERIC|nr:Kinesin-like protein KIN-10A [Camellia lanceoleosa]